MMTLHALSAGFVQGFTRLARRRAGRLAVAATLIALGIVVSATGRDASAAGKRVTLRGSTSLPATQVTWAPYLTIGMHLGWFNAEGLDVSIDNVPTATGLTLLARGDVDFSVQAAESVFPVEARGTRTGTRLAYNLYVRNWYLLGVVADSPIRSIAQLKGKAVGLVSLGPPQVPYVALYLREAGLRPEDVQLVAVGNQVSAAHMLSSKQIDATVQMAATFATFESAGFKFRYLPKPKDLDALFGSGISVNERSLSDPVKKDALGRYFRVLSKSLLFARTNPEAAVRIHWKLRPESKPTGQPEDKALANAKKVLSVVLEHTGRSRSGRWSEYLRDDVRAYVALLGFTAQLPDPEALYTAAFVDAANDWKEDEVIEFAKTYKVQ